VYASNRGHDSLATFAVESDSGRLTLIGQTSTRGKIPRNFLITPDGRLLLAANQNSGNIVTFWIDESSGELEYTGQEAAVPAPVCLKLLPHRE
jgi:6-phosphogluconolactonase